jgi:vacuolar-type H+-ATPase subunit I/STV1
MRILPSHYTSKIPMLIDLQLFGEGTGSGDGGTGAEGAKGETVTAAMSQTKGEKNPLANVKYGIQEDTPPAAKVETDPPTEDRNAKFEALIKGEYKDLYDARMQDTIQKRLKSTKETVDKYEALTPTLEMLAKKYGVDASDIKALNKAIEEDDAYYEEEALEKGISVEQLKEIRKMEKENADLKRQMEEQNRKENANKVYAQWMEQAESTKQIYPSFDLRAEMQNQRFVDLLRSNIDVRTAYEVIHKDDIIAGAMQFTAKKMEQNITNKIIANGARPSENGNSSQSASVVKSDVSQLSKADRQEIIRRVQRGEKIKF